MATRKQVQAADTSTQEKIKQAARQVFHHKGYAATRTRDIAEAAGINLALLNYYFRSKEKLFDLIMLETMQAFLQSMAVVFNDSSSTLQEKIQTMTDRYIDLLVEEPGIPLFIMSELRAHPGQLMEKLHMKEMLMKSVFVRQYQQAVREKKIPALPFLHFLMNLMSLIVFPFIASPILQRMGDLNDRSYQNLLRERKALIPRWIAAMMKVKSLS